MSLSRMRRVLNIPNLACGGVSRGVATTSKVVNCDLVDIEIPNLTFSQMCWSRADMFKDKLALVGILEVLGHRKKQTVITRLMP